MDLTHTFTVPASVEDTWAAFIDIESVAGCFPGATVTSFAGDDFEGSCKVKLGPISLVYSGTGRFVERDESAHRFVIEAKGKDKRGNGTAGALVTASMTPAGAGTTDVEVVTDLAITGKPAQFGRGVMQDVSDKLLQQFVDCLESKVRGPGVEAEVAGEVAGEVAPAAAAPGAHAATPAAPRMTYSGPPMARPVTSPAAPRGSDDAIDLGTTVLPILLKTYWMQIAGGLLVLLVLKRLLGGRRG